MDENFDIKNDNDQEIFDGQENKAIAEIDVKKLKQNDLIKYEENCLNLERALEAEKVMCQKHLDDKTRVEHEAKLKQSELLKSSKEQNEKLDEFVYKYNQLNTDYKLLLSNKNELSRNHHEFEKANRHSEQLCKQQELKILKLGIDLIAIQRSYSF